MRSLSFGMGMRVEPKKKAPVVTETPTLDVIADQLPHGNATATVYMQTRQVGRPLTYTPVTVDGMALHLLCQQTGRDPADLKDAHFTPQRIASLRTALNRMEAEAIHPGYGNNPAKMQTEAWHTLYQNAIRRRHSRL